MAHPARPIGLALAAIALAACTAPAAGPGTGTATGGTDDATAGTVVSVRELPAQGAATRVLAAFGSDAPTGAAGLREIVVRDDGGRTLSIVQDDATAWRAGERVRLRPGASLSLVRPGE